MFLKLLLLSSLLCVSPFACTRIVKHYHYHFGGSLVTFPVPSKTSANVAVSLYLAKHPVTEAEFDILNYVAMHVPFGSPIADALKTTNLVLVSRYTGYNCQQVVDAIEKLIKVEGKDQTVEACESRAQAMEEIPTEFFESTLIVHRAANAKRTGY